MIALVELLPAIGAIVWSAIRGLGLGYLVWKLESTGAANQVAVAVGNAATGAGDTVKGIGQVPSGLLVAGGVLAALVLLRR